MKFKSNIIGKLHIEFIFLYSFGNFEREKIAPSEFSSSSLNDRKKEEEQLLSNKKPASNQGNKMDYLKSNVDSKNEEPREKSLKSTIDIKYLRITYSKYTEARAISHESKDQLYGHELATTKGLFKSFEDFDPLEFGYEISRISKGGKSFLEVDVDDNGKKIFTFPSAKSCSPEHQLLHGIKELMGYSFGKLGIGAIPKCSESCRPYFTWLKNNSVYRTGEFLYWIELDDLSPGIRWKCNIRCNKCKQKK